SITHYRPHLPGATVTVKDSHQRKILADVGAVDVEVVAVKKLNVGGDETAEQLAQLHRGAKGRHKMPEHGVHIQTGDNARAHDDLAIQIHQEDSVRSQIAAQG